MLMKHESSMFPQNIRLLHSVGLYGVTIVLRLVRPLQDGGNLSGDVVATEMTVTVGSWPKGHHFGTKS